jgi:Protein of unknown function (DUF4232)
VIRVVLVASVCVLAGLQSGSDSAFGMSAHHTRSATRVVCDPTQVQSRFVSDGAERVLGGIVFTNTSTQACILSGFTYTQLEGLASPEWGDGPWEYRNGAPSTKATPPPTPPVLLRPGGASEAGVRLAWRDWCAGVPTSIVLHFRATHGPAFVVRLPPGADPATTGPSARCADGGGQSSTLFVSTVRSYDKNGFREPQSKHT